MFPRSPARTLRCLLLGVMLLPTLAAAQEVKIASFRAFAFFPAWFAKDAGFFEREGLNVEILFFSSGNEMTSAMLSRSVSFSTTSADRPMLLRDKGQQTLNLIALTVRSPFSLLVPPTASLAYADIAALKGKKIGITQRGSSTDTAIRVLLRPAGIDPDRDVTLLALGSAENGVAALKTGQIEALIVTEPGTSIATHQEKVAKLHLDLRKGEGPPAASRATFFTLQATEDFVRANTELTRKVMRAVCLATKAAKADVPAAAKVAQKYYPKMDPALLSVILANEAPTFGSEITADMISGVSESALAAKVIQKAYTLDNVVIGKDHRPLWRC